MSAGRTLSVTRWIAAVCVAAGFCTLAPRVLADHVILDDLIVDGSACVGQDCVNGESFGFDTLRLKENNLRIKFQDTSNTASFPSNDWQITANESSNGGKNKFSIDDIDGGRTPFTVEAGAPTNSLYVESSGEIGLGTSTPVVEIHVKEGDTPTLRLEQDGSSGFTPQTWDIAGNESGFFVRDVTNGSTLPFRILPGADSQTLVITGDEKIGIGAGTSPDAKFHIENTSGDDEDDFAVTEDGEVGIGTDSPQRSLHVSDTVGRIRLSDSDATSINDNTAGVEFYRGENDARSGFFTMSNGDLSVGTDEVGGTLSLSVNTNDVALFINSSRRVGIGNENPSTLLEVGSTGGGANARCNGTTWIDVSSREVKENITGLGSSEAVEAMKQLAPVKFNYKQNPNELSVGFIAEDVPELVAWKDRKSLSSMDIVAVLTKVTQLQQSTIEGQQQLIADLRKRLEKLEAQRSACGD